MKFVGRVFSKLRLVLFASVPTSALGGISCRLCDPISWRERGKGPSCGTLAEYHPPTAATGRGDDISWLLPLRLDGFLRQ